MEVHGGRCLKRLGSDHGLLHRVRVQGLLRQVVLVFGSLCAGLKRHKVAEGNLTPPPQAAIAAWGVSVDVDFGNAFDFDFDFDFDMLTALKGWIGQAPQGRGALHIIYNTEKNIIRSKKICFF